MIGLSDLKFIWSVFFLRLHYKYHAHFNRISHFCFGLFLWLILYHTASTLFTLRALFVLRRRLAYSIYQLSWKAHKIVFSCQRHSLIIYLTWFFVIFSNLKHPYNTQLLSLLDLKPQNFGLTFLTFFILFNNLIPISLPVTLEVRLLHMLFEIVL